MKKKPTKKKISFYGVVYTENGARFRSCDYPDTYWNKQDAIIYFHNIPDDKKNCYILVRFTEANEVKVPKQRPEIDN